jgi:hypothetical protein
VTVTVPLALSLRLPVVVPVTVTVRMPVPLAVGATQAARPLSGASAAVTAALALAQPLHCQWQCRSTSSLSSTAVTRTQARMTRMPVIMPVMPGPLAV